MNVRRAHVESARSGIGSQRSRPYTKMFDGLMRFRLHVDSRTAAAYQSSPNRFGSGPPATSSPRHIRVASEQELRDRMMATTDYINQHPVVQVL